MRSLCTNLVGLFLQLHYNPEMRSRENSQVLVSKVQLVTVAVKIFHMSQISVVR